jgi:PAS domain S-box-containing protein
MTEPDALGQSTVRPGAVRREGLEDIGTTRIDTPATIDARPLPPAMAGDILGSMTDGVLAVDPRGVILLINPVAETVLGVHAAEVIGRPFAEVFVPRRDLEAFNDAMLAAIYNRGRAQSRDLTLTAAGNERHLSVRTALLITRDDGAVEGVVAVIADVSERVMRLRDAISLERTRTSTGRFIVATLTIFSLFTLALEPIQEFARATGVDLGAWAGLLVMTVAAFGIRWWTGLPFRDLGISWRLSRRDLRVCLSVSVAFCAALTVCKAVALAVWAAPDGMGRTLFEAWRMDTGEVVSDPMILAAAVGFYLVTLPIQELGSRSAIQAPLHRFLDGVVPAPGWAANGVTTLMFAVLHAHLAPTVALMVVLPSLLWGWLFMRSGTILSPILSHAIIGVYAVFALGLFNGFDNV